MARVREDERFKSVGPDAAVIRSNAGLEAGEDDVDEEDGDMWLDWAFIEFWKSNYCKFSRPPSSFSTLTLITLELIWLFR